MNFRTFVEGAGLAADFTAMSMQDRMAQGRDIGEPFIRKVLKDKYNIDIKPSQGYHQDARLKIDGFWNGEPVQIKLRRSGRDDRNDIAYELVRNHDSRKPIRSELQDPHQQGRDYKGTTVKHYFIMNKTETAVYHVPAESIRKAVEVALDELEAYHQGYLNRPFSAVTNGVQLRPTVDRDPNSFTPNKVMAFVPVDKVSDQTYDITEKPSMRTAAAPQPIPAKSTPEPIKPMVFPPSIKPKGIPVLGKKQSN